MASRSKSAAAAFTSVIAVLSCILEPPGYAISGKISGAQAHQVTFSGDSAPWPDYPGMNIRAEWNAVTISR
jgi:hypothetical protein